MARHKAINHCLSKHRVQLQPMWCCIPNWFDHVLWLAAPEILANSRHYDGHAADVWSAGVMLFVSHSIKLPLVVCCILTPTLSLRQPTGPEIQCQLERSFK